MNAAMRTLAALALAAVAVAATAVVSLGACGSKLGSGLTDGGPPADAASSGDAGGCAVSIALDPATPEAGDHVHASAVVSGAVGVPTYTWTLDGSAATSYEAPDDSAIGFDVPTAQPHTVAVAITGTSSPCPPATLAFDVTNPTGALATYRLRVVPPAALAPPFETAILVHGGTSAMHDVPLDPGVDVAGTVTGSGGAGVPAYLRFVPASGPTIDTFSTLTGAFDVRTQLAPYTVVVVPELAGLAPQAFAWTFGTTTFALGAGTTVTGTVTAPDGSPVANAQVQLASGGVPSTIATTSGSGAFAVQDAFAPGAQVTATIAPPAGSGLARLTAAGLFDLTKPMQVVYSAAAQTCDLGGDTVTRSGAPVAGAQVTVVGALAGTAGTVTTGVVVAPASGAVYATATASSAGVLPSLPVPRASGLSAVVLAAYEDYAVAVLDTTACAPQAIDAPPQIAAQGVVTLQAQDLAGVQIEAIPEGALAQVTLVPTDTVATSHGFTLLAATGASYELRLADPSGQGAPTVLDGVAANAVPAAIAIGGAVALTGTVSIIDVASAVPGAAVELLCAACTGVDADRPLAQAATDVQGHYQLIVPDPGQLPARRR